MEEINNFTKKVEELVYYLDDVSGNKLYRIAKKEYNKLIQENPANEEAFIALQFLIIPFLSTNEIADLIKNSLFLGLSVNDIDIVERINKKLLFMDFEDRDGVKNNIKNALVENQEQITDTIKTENGKEIKTMADWLGDYLSSTGKEIGSSIGEAKYFNNSYFKKIKPDEKILLKKLFNFYLFLNISSSTPEGFEDDILLRTEDDKLITTNKGNVVVLYDYRTGQGAVKLKPKARKVSGPPKTEEELNIDELKAEEERYAAGGIERLALEEEVGKKKKIEDLKIEANKYRDGSLEKKALLEEIKKLQNG
ncbi:hypothetical protein DRH27_03635 [Candidatus Falkowbacteria bacterium]|nr:MAG: hypothetical protein DRH27_03635 [Candidatus Falkowbacteria bacterium]